jgi:hypothetical protein
MRVSTLVGNSRNQPGITSTRKRHANFDHQIQDRNPEYDRHALPLIS